MIDYAFENRLDVAFRHIILPYNVGNAALCFVFVFNDFKTLVYQRLDLFCQPLYFG